MRRSKVSPVRKLQRKQNETRWLEPEVIPGAIDLLLIYIRQICHMSVRRKVLKVDVPRPSIGLVLPLIRPIPAGHTTVR